MALSIYNNVASLTAQRALSVASGYQGKSLERLSTGLRINHAADDASGLAISEKLRSQIRGFQKASMNAQDGISYLQTAEGGMEVMTSMLQRMRELAVQAGNGTYTTNDRAMLQLEVDQLKDEINRVSSSTEFNTKKLLNGDAAALWSSDQNFISAIVRGPVVAEGNYKINAVMDPVGQNAKYKTDIMRVNEGVLVSEVTKVSANDTISLTSVRDPYNIPVTSSSGLTVTVGGFATATTAAASVTVPFKQEGSNWDVKSVSANADISYSGYFEIEFTNTGVMSAKDTAKKLEFQFRAMDAKTGELTAWQKGGVSVADADSAVLTLRVGTAATDVVTIGMPYGGDFKTGDKMLGYFQAKTTAVTDGVKSGIGTIRITSDAKDKNSPISNGPMIAYDKVGELVKANDDDGKDDYNEVTVHMANMDKNTGIVYYGSLTMEFKEGEATDDNTPGVGPLATGTTTVKIRDNGVATKDTKLSDISVFTNDDGVNILANTQELKIYAAGKNTTVYLESDDTVEDFINKMNKAIVDDLGLGADPMTTAGKTVNNNLIKYVPNLGTTANTSESVPGTFIIQTAKLGDDSNLVFVGDQRLIDALSLATLQESKNSSMEVTVTDAHTGEFVGSDTVGDGMLRNVIKGMDVVLGQNFGIDPTWNPNTKQLEFTANGKNSSGYLHVVDNRTELQIGANQGQTINVSVGQLDTTGLEIDDVYIVDMALAQRAVTKIDKAIEKINATRATVGAQINRLEYTIQNLQTARENLTAAESRIRDLDMAEETSNLTKNQVLVQAATAMVAQANQVPQQALTLLKG